MLIKRVTIQGFKTFANRTDFIFDPGVTAVVGPNGSGKSNIVDAVRWCLGEQSFSLLRSKKTADVIFSGSDKRARLGMAEVSLLLDNSQGEIPIDFSEVEITRRAYRDGENEYLVNGQRVRLGDIAELLAQTGLGKRTYAVIGQGLIDKVLSLTPEERRTLFEEAAGITNYQIKRESTLKRLEATQTNLARVHDIVAELSPRLGHLKRQADRAREREQIANDLRLLLRDWYGYRWHTAVAEMKLNQSDTSQFKEAVATRQQTLSEIGLRIEALRLQQSLLRSELGDLHRQSSALHRQAEGTGRELAVAQERLRQTQTRLEETQRELSPLQLQKETYSTRLEELKGSLAEAQQLHKERTEAVQRLQISLDRQQGERAKLQLAVDSARRVQNEIQQRLTDTQSRLNQLGEQRNLLQGDLQRQQQKLGQLAEEAARTQAILQAAEAALHQGETQVAQLQDELQKSQNDSKSLRSQLQEAEQQRQQADRELDRLQTRYDLLKRLQNEGAGYASGVRSVLQSGQAGILGTVASLLRVPTGLDKAIETALGGAFQNVVTAHWEAAQQAIEMLKRTGRGRATFLPLDRLHVPSKLEAPKREGVLGNAADLVQYDAAVAPAMEQLLNRVWITKDLPSARRVLDEWRDSLRPTVVTSEGEIIRPGGAVTGGSEGERRDESVFARERELRELPIQINGATKRLQQASTRSAEVNRQLAATQTASDSLQQRLGELLLQDRRQRQQVEEARRQVDRALQAQRFEQERASQLEQSVSVNENRQGELTRSLQELQNNLQQAAAQVSQAQAEAEVAGLDELLRQLADARANAGEALGYLRSQQSLHENQQRNLQSVGDQLIARQFHMTTLQGEIGELSQRIEGLTAQENELSRQIETLRQQIEPREQQLSSLEQQQAAEENAERSCQQVLRKEENALNNAQLHLQRGEDMIYQLRNEIEQDLGLVNLPESADMAYQPPLPWDTFVEQLPVLENIPDSLENEVRETRIRLGRLVNVNPDAPREYAEAAERYEFLRSQSADLEAAAGDMRKVISELDGLMKVELQRTYEVVSKQFVRFFQMLFNGGTAQLELTVPDDIMNSGVEIVARPPGKRPQSLALLSGGERALSACALIFAILYASPTPFCVLDEVDAALDEANVDRLRNAIDKLSEQTQFIVVTHNRRTLEGSNAIYGVTMGNDGVSRVISLKLEGDKIIHHNGNGAEQVDKGQIEAIEELVKM
ncbi:MAG: chromosome segregation protein SMC [Caldilineaceae bacterium]